MDRKKKKQKDSEIGVSKTGYRAIKRGPRVDSFSLEQRSGRFRPLPLKLAAMAKELAPLPKSAYFGQLQHDTPEIGIFVDGKKDWCSRIYTQRDKRTTERVHTYKKEWDVFSRCEGYDQLRKCDGVLEHFDIVKIDVNPDAADKRGDYDFGFYVDNSFGQKSSECAIASFYSGQEQKMAFSQLIVKPGRKEKLLRFEKYDKAFSLTLNSHAADDRRSAEEMLSDASTKDACFFTIMTTKGKLATKGKLNKRECVDYDYHCFSEDGDDDYDYDCYSVDGGGLKTQTDGPSQKYHHANIVRGKETNQTFNYVNIKHTGAPIDIYNVTIVMSVEPRNQTSTGLCKCPVDI